jgi:molybdopterin molybdotransferase
MVTIEEAQKIILQNCIPLSAVEIPLVQGLGRVTSHDIHSPWDIPAADNSAMDGYAFSSTGLKNELLSVSGFLPAGTESNITVATGSAIKIMTGAPVPPGCDTVVPFEDTELTGTGIRLKGPVKPGAHIRQRGEDVKTGDLVIGAGTVLRPPEIGMLASLGKKSFLAIPRPRVAILATGDELLEPGEALQPGRIMNSNSYSIAAQVTEAGAEPVLLGIARDDRIDTLNRIKAGLDADLVIVTGGVSVGDHDFVKEVIGLLGGSILFWKVNLKPGKPVAFAVIKGIPLFALPGNPVAAMVTFELFVRPALLNMMGYTKIFRPTVTATLTEPISNKGERPHLIRVLAKPTDTGYTATPTGNQSSARLSSLTTGNGLIRVEAGGSLASGDSVKVFVMDREFCMEGSRQWP